MPYCLGKISVLLTLTAAMRPMSTDQLEQELESDKLCCCHKTMAPVEICVKDTQVFAKVELKDALLQKPDWFNASLEVRETYQHGTDILKEDQWTKFLQLPYLGELEAPTGLGLDNPKFMDFYYTEYKHHEKKGRNAPGADSFNFCTDRLHKCDCEFYSGAELKLCLEKPLEHCSGAFECQEWVQIDKCTMAKEQTKKTMKLMHKNSNMRIGSCFDKKQLKTRMMMAQCPEGYEKCDCNNRC